MRKMLLIPLLLSLCFGCACVHINRPYDPGTPEPADHEGVFVSEHGKLTFPGDGESVFIDFDSELARLTGLPEGEHEGTYVFLSGDLPPHGSIPVRYDTAYELRITVGEFSSVMELGVVSEDGSSAKAALNMVTPERIPLLFKDNGSYIQVAFQK